MTAQPLCQLCVQRVLEELENPTGTSDITVRQGVILQPCAIQYEAGDGVTGGDEVTVPVCARCAHTRSRFLLDCVAHEIDLALADSDGPRPRREGRLVC